MKAYCITVKNNEISEKAMDKCLKSSKKVGNDFDIKVFDAYTEDDVESYMSKNNLKWNYPWEGSQLDFVTGLRKSAYTTRVKEKRIACALSHYELWKKCVDTSQPFLILEHDAFFENKIDFQPQDFPYNILGINDPIGATRKSREYREKILNNKERFQPVPYIDSFEIPQGLAGNSAYIIKPAGAAKMINLASEFGLWPNDALMCKQLVPSMGVSRKFYTKVQGSESLTTL